VGRRPTRSLTAIGVDVREVMRPNRQHRRRHGKSDEADAIGAARAVLAGDAVGIPKSQTGQVEAIRLLRVARRSAMKARTQAANQIHAVIDTAPEQLRRHFVGNPTTAIVAEAARFRRRRRPDTPLEAARLALRTLARRWEYLNEELDELDDLTAEAAPTLRAINGVGAQVATALLAAAGDNPQRLRSSSSFAALCGVSPIDASSGRPAAPPPQPLRRPPSQLGAAHHHHQSASLAPADAGLHGETSRRGTHPEDDLPLPQTTRRARSPPRHHHRPRPRPTARTSTRPSRLTSKEASVRDTSWCAAGSLSEMTARGGLRGRLRASSGGRRDLRCARCGPFRADLGLKASVPCQQSSLSCRWCSVVSRRVV
jgi:hypothetical protein